MKCDIVLAGVGGQGVLSLSAVIAWSALKEGLRVKQSEVHGMAQRGGAVVANLRLADREIMSDLIPEGSAALVLAMEPLEALRYLRYLAPAGKVVSATAPVVNIPDYPPLDEVLARLRAVPGGAVLVDAERLARAAGSARATNMVIAGAASRYLPIRPETMEHFIETRFAGKGEAAVRQNLAAFRAGREAAAP